MAAITLGAAAASALLAAAALRLPLVSSLLAAYLAFVANLGCVTLALSPVHEVTRTGLTAAELVLLAAAVAAWQLRGRPLPDASGVRAAARDLRGDPVILLALAFLAALLAYELVLGLTVPPNNTDALAYHLPKAVAWAQHGGIFWIPNAPTVRLNAFQPLAEQQILFLLAVTGSGALANLPQLLAELAILVAIYGSSGSSSPRSCSPLRSWRRSSAAGS